jgi:hypothetical protein
MLVKSPAFDNWAEWHRFIVLVMHELVSAAAATAQFFKGIGMAVMFIAIYWYWRWLPQPHFF